METPITDMVRQYIDANLGWISEADRISAIALLASNGDYRHPHGNCTETSEAADSICGARSLVELAMSKIHE